MNLPEQIQITVDGALLPFDIEKIPALFVAYMAAKRVEYYANIDEAKGDSFQVIFKHELRQTLKDPADIRDWAESNTNWDSTPTTGIEITHTKGGSHDR